MLKVTLALSSLSFSQDVKPATAIKAVIHKNKIPDFFMTFYFNLVVNYLIFTSELTGKWSDNLLSTCTFVETISIFSFGYPKM